MSSNFTALVVDGLGPIDDEELPFVVSAIEDLKQKGWLIEEAVAKLRWCEHVDPHADEATALLMMRQVEERVMLRKKRTVTLATLMQVIKAGGTLDVDGLLDNAIGGSFRACELLTAARRLRTAQREFDHEVAAAQRAVDFHQ